MFLLNIKKMELRNAAWHNVTVYLFQLFFLTKLQNFDKNQIAI